MKITLYSVVFACISQAALADVMTCRFNTECYEDEACIDTSYNVQFERKVPAATEWTLWTDFGSFDATVTEASAKAGVTVIAQGAGMSQLFVIAPDGMARHASVLADGPQIISYLGECGVFQ